MKKIAVVFLIGFIICLIVSIPLVAWAVWLDDEENGNVKKSEERLKDLPKVVLAAAVLSVFWIFAMPLYISMLGEKIRGKRG